MYVALKNETAKQKYLLRSTVAEIVTFISTCFLCRNCRKQREYEYESTQGSLS